MRTPFGGARPRGLVIAVLLLLALGLAGALALEAHRTFLSHRATAERVLKDNARYAAARFANRLEMQLYYVAFSPVTEALWHSKAATPGGLLPPPAQVVAGLEHRPIDFGKLVRYTFRYDVRTKHLETAGPPPSERVRRWLLDTLPTNSRRVYDREEHLAVILRTVDGARRAVVYTMVKDAAGAPQTLLGFEGDPKVLDPLYMSGEDKFPLVPRALTGGVIYDSLGSMIVKDADGVELYRSPVQYQPMFADSDTVEAFMGAMKVQVALRPDVAPKLIIGGMPRPSWPRLLVLLTLTAALIVAALLQLRREYELSRLRADFVSGVSHELRTPLAQIRMFSETLLLGRVRSEGERTRSLEIIDQEARRLTHLVENLLHFSRSERRATRLSPAPAPLATLVRQTVEAFAPLAAARGVALRTELAEAVVATVDADALHQMLLNLLDNAVKYGPPNQTVTIGLSATETLARIWVADEGPGIPAADRDRIWERFCRLERDRGSAAAGTGIGLSVVRELAALHGGRAWVEDAPATGRSATGERGARFVIELPLVPVPEPVPSPAPLREEAGAGSGAEAGAGVPA
jgi:signal transduction histidine kinase